MAAFPATPADQTLTRKLYVRLMPFLVLLFTLAYLDRVNVGFVKDQLHDDLGMSAAAYGLGAGIFFIGYALFEVPSNIILARVGARRWLARIGITWSILAAAIAFSPNVGTFYVLRFLLGVAEAGLFPGVIYYLSLWFPERARARAVGYFTWAGPIASIVGGPVAGAILSMHDTGPLRGWQWLLIIEAVPSLLVGVLILFVLKDSPDKAPWLTDTERARLREVHAAEAAERELLPVRTVSRTLLNPTVLLLVLVYFAMQLSIYGVTFWLPTIVARIHALDEFGVGVVSAIPWVVAAVGVFCFSRYSDATGRRRAVVCAAIATGAVFEAASALIGSPVLAVAALCLSLAGFLGASPVFWTLPAGLLQGTSAAAGIALIGGLGNTGGFVGPYVMGLVEDGTGSQTAGMILLAFCGLVGAGLVWLTRRGRRAERQAFAESVAR